MIDISMIVHCLQYFSFSRTRFQFLMTRNVYLVLKLASFFDDLVLEL